jgi:hypothetical protein
MAKYVSATCIAIAISLAISSCAVFRSPAQRAQALIEEGSRLFSAGYVAEAERTWAGIPDSEKREEYTAYAQAYSAYDAAVSRAEKALSSAGPEAAMAAVSGAGAIPAAPTAVVAPDPLGAAARLDRVATTAGAALASRAASAESSADGSLIKTRTGAIADRVAAASKAVDGYIEAARLYRSAGDRAPEAGAGASRSSSKAAKAEELHKALLKESLVSFSDRMGEVFARSPADTKKLDDKALLAFNAETDSLIRHALAEFDQVVAAYPDLIDPTKAEKLRLSASSLSARFARIEGAIKATKNRGRPVMPLLIGIFNPQPGDSQRSRPGSFTGSSVSGSDWWWGIVDIPKGLAQDLVITMSDNRPVRVYAAGQGSSAGKTASDLVNPLFKVGNSWPVLNAGERLENGIFHIEVGPGLSSSYSGEAVVYKSFVVRTR